MRTVVGGALALTFFQLALFAGGAASAAAQPQSQETMRQGMTEERELADAQARAHFRAGRSLYDAGRFQQAAEEFEEAYRLSQRAELLFNAYVAFRDANDLAGAVRSLRGYLENTQEVEDRVNLEARLRSMTAALEQRQTQEQALEQARLERERERASRPRRGPPPPPPEVWPWIVMSVGAAMVVGGAIAGGVALSETDSLVAVCPNLECGAGIDLDGRRATIDALGLTADVLLFGGGAVTLTGLVLGLVFGLPSGSAEEIPEQPVSAACGPSGCGVSFRTRF